MLTLKLSHIAWSGAPYRWIYTRTLSGGGTASYSGPASTSIGDRAGIEARTGHTFGPAVGRGGPEILVDDATLYVVPPGQNCADGGGEMIWQIGDSLAIPSDWQWEGFRFEGEPAHDVEAWIGGVRQVTALGDVHPTSKALLDVVNGNDPRFAYLCGPGEGIEIWTWLGSEKNTTRKVIMVRFDDGSTRTMLVERAWLLGSNGDTIQRVAP